MFPEVYVTTKLRSGVGNDRITSKFSELRTARKAVGSFEMIKHLKAGDQFVVITRLCDKLAHLSKMNLTGNLTQSHTFRS